MSTRYVWKKYTYSDPYLLTVSEGVGVLAGSTLSTTSNTKIILCSQCGASLNAYGKPYISTGGNKVTVVDGASFSNGSWSTDTYAYAVFTYPDENMAQQYVITSTESGQYWRIANRSSSDSTKIFFLSKSHSGTYWNTHDGIGYEQDLFQKTTQQYVSSGESGKYPSKFEFVNSESGAFSYQGFDNIDPTGISYPTNVNVGDSFAVTALKSSSISYGGTISYVFDMQVDGGSWSGNYSTDSLVINVSNIRPSGTRKYRVHAKDNYGFESTTYATGPLLTVVGDSTISVSAVPTAGGSVSGGGTYSAGSSVTVIASPNSGYSFLHWLEGSTQVSTNASYTFTASGDRTLTAVFTATTTYYTVSVSASPTAVGSVSGGGSYASGSSVTVRAVANSGYNFTGWYESNTLKSSSTSYTFTVTANKTLQARFSTQGSSGTGSGHDAFIGISNIARKVSNIYIGVNGVARKVTKGYIGVDEKARMFFDTGWSNKWISSTIPSTSTNYRCLCFGNGMFVAMTHGYSVNNAIYSSDGITWNTSSTFPTSFGCYGLAYGNGKFVAIRYGYTAYLYSTDGINWNTSSLPSVTDAPWIDIAYGNGKFVLASRTGDTAYSTDGVNWTKSTFPSTSGFNVISAGGGKFVAVRSGSNQIAYSTDGINWTAYNSLPYSKEWISMIYEDGKFILASGYKKDESSSILYSTDGLSWASFDAPSSYYWACVSSGKNKIVATYSSTMSSSLATGSFYSESGGNWSFLALPSATYSGSATSWNKIVYGNGKFVASSFNGPNIAYIIA